MQYCAGFAHGIISGDEKLKEFVETNKQKIEKILIIVLVIALVCSVVGCIFLSNRLTATSEDLSETLSTLNTVSEELNERIEAEKDKSFDYLAIGNSITRHPPAGELWYGDWGMAASDADHDYVHLVGAELEKRYSESTFTAFNYTCWEAPYYMRNNTLQYLDGALNEDLDYITIELGENIVRGDETYDEMVETLKEDYSELIDYIEEKCPKAKIVIIGTYWENDYVLEAEEYVCVRKGIEYIDVSAVRGSEYRVGAGEDVQVMGVDGQLHAITDANGVGQHPGDEAMEYYATQVIQHLPDEWEPEE